MTTTSEYPAFLAPAEEAREHGYEDDYTAPEEPQPDPAAPWGRKSDGTPKAKPGRPSGTPDKEPRTRQRRRITAAAPPKRKAPRASSKQPAHPDYRPGLLGIAQLLAAPLAVAGIKSPSCALDAAAITVHAEGLAEACQQTAEQVPQFAAVLDKVLTVGPWGALLTATLPLAVQLLANHNVLPLPVTQAMGALAPDDLIALMTDDQAQA